MMKFARGFYKHKAFKDVFIEILRVQYVDEKRTKARVIWWNMGYVGEPYMIHRNEPIIIKKEQYENWVRFSPNQGRKAYDQLV